ncbi:hypothetical protein [Rhodanobacter sp. C03]|uniref:hypothetical protein n=1 Tax=Rhodanobacter sp. C03 TaxID=1945858 RepID=UPI0009844C09|nr:hypothetical protein [Rhodanobacter sp. C03]OOG56184.1 hypothetical protein B0E48_08225 [Rhodanobacter sp. C03]
MFKEEELKKIVAKRRSDRLKGYKCLGDYQGGLFDCEFVSPYSKGAHNFDSDVMVLLQDWSSDHALQRSKGPSELGRDPNLPTNRNLDSLLKSALGMEFHETYTTNLFPYIKGGGLSSRIPFVDLVFAAEEFAIPQIRIVAPRLVVCLGKNTFNALRVAVAKLELTPGLSRCHDMAGAIDSPFDIEFDGCKIAIWAQAHPGAWGQRNRNKGDPERASNDWKRMSRAVGLSSNS